MKLSSIIASAFSLSHAEAKRLIRQGAVTVWSPPPGHRIFLHQGKVWGAKP